MRNQYSPQMICIAAAFMALVCIMTLFFKVPIPLGYAHLGNGIILLGCFLLGNPYAVWIGGIGSAMADLLGGYTEWIFPTLVIKGAMGYVIGFLSHPGKNTEKKSVKVLSFQAALSVIAGTAVMILGYGIAGGLMYGSFAAGESSLPGLIMEGVVGILMFYILGSILEKQKLINKMGETEG